MDQTNGSKPSSSDAPGADLSPSGEVEAIYEDGVLRPRSAPGVPDNARVQLRLTVLPKTEEAQQEEPITALPAAQVTEAEAASLTLPPPSSRRGTWRNPLAIENNLLYALLLAALLVGGVMRLSHLDWDQNAHYHPDERWITMVTNSMALPNGVAQFFAPRSSPLNPYYDSVEKHPRNFAYGTLPVYLTSATGWLLSHVDEKWSSYDYFPLIGRAISGLLDTGAILLVFLLGRRLWGEGVGALGALFYALTVLSIQHSHFYTTDITLNFFILLTIFGAAKIMDEPRAWHGFFAGAAAGMALASKFSAAPIVAVIPVALFLRWWGWRLPSSAAQTPRPSIKQCLLVLLAAALGFLALNFLFQPYAYLDSAGLIASIREQNRIIVTGEGDMPYTRQYLQTTPYLYFLDQIVRWAFGWPLGLAALIGWAWLVVLAVRRRSPGAVLLLAWMVPYFLITGRFHAKFLRYALPLLPFLALAAALVLVQFRQQIARAGIVSPLRHLPTALIALVVAGTVYWAGAFFRIYSEPHTANRAAAWINQNVPVSSRLLKEHWEEGLANLNPRFSVPPAVPELPMYEPDDARKLAILAKLLSENDYIVFYSQRLYATVSRLPERYPMSRRYYELLFSNQLGYELVHFSASYPRFAGVAVTEDTFSRPELPVPAPLAAYKPSLLTINGGFADESFAVYDHPLVMVFKKTRPITAQEIDAALRPYLPPNRR
ncbi:MAG TPA: glycosyltransferase family 39 protein [Pyrinomonadaceae bacterium]|nr:glycosyltransferase family 39 protein [Pyrinomonadaceae bacterium]